MDNNPLKKFFRQPAIYFRLPSQGRGYPPGTLNLPPNGEIPIYPMTAMDEITYRTPDALFNGEAVVSVIQSCAPAISDGWIIPSTDFDALLVAIRIASYGHSMDIDTTCPKCQAENSFGLDLRTVIDNLKAADYTQKIQSGDLMFHFRPLNYREMTDNSQMQFEQQKLLQSVAGSEMSESEKVHRLNEMMKRVVSVTVDAIARSVIEIRTPDAVVTEYDHIREFLNNCDRGVFGRVRDHVLKLREESEIKPLKITCPSCENQYEQPFTLDMSSFFVPGS